MGSVNTMRDQHMKQAAAGHFSGGKSWLTQLITAIALFSAGVAAHAANTLDFIDFKKLENNGVEIRLALSEAAPQANATTNNFPAQIYLDLPGVTNNLPWNLPLPVEVGEAKNIKAVQSNDHTRVVVNVGQLVDYATRTDGKNLYITLAGDTKSKVKPSTEAPTPAPAPAAAPAPKPKTDAKPQNSKLTSLKSISFNALPGDSVQVRLSFSKPVATPGPA